MADTVRSCGTALSLAGLLAMCGYAAASPLYSDIAITQETETGLRLSFAPGSWKVDTLAGEAIVAFAGAQWSTQPGARAYPLRSALVAVPAEGEVTVTASPAGWQTVTPYPAAVRPALNPRGASVATRVPPPAVLRWEGPFWTRDLRVIRIWLAPVQPLRDGLARTERIDVEVTWSPAEGTRAQAPSRLFDPIYRGTVLNYERAASFRATPARAAIDNPFGNGTDWYKVIVTAEGPHVLTSTQLQAAGFPVTSSDPTRIRMFYAGGRLLPVANTTPRPVLREIPIEVTGADDFRFDPGDAIYFYGQAANRWENGTAGAEYIDNPYTRDVIYWIVPDGAWGDPPLRIGAQSAAPGSDPAVRLGTGRVTAEQNQQLNLDADDYYTWYWQKTSLMTVLLNLPGAVSGPGEVTVATRPTWTLSNSSVLVNGQPATFVSAVTGRTTYASEGWLPTTQLRLSYTLPGDSWIDRVEATYPLRLDAAAVRGFWLDPAAGNRAEITNVPAGSLLWDISKPDSPVVVTGQPSGNMLAFDPATGIGPRHFHLWTRSQARAPVAVTAARPGGLRQNPISEDMIILTHPQLLAPLDAYANHREAQSGITTEIVSVLDVYDDFGFGQFDPVAIRDFLKYTYETASPRPSAVLLVGDGSYDFQNHLGAGTPNLIPPFIVDPAVDETAGDQNYVSFGRLGTLDHDTSRVLQGDRGWDMMIARWPVRDVTETRIVADKIVAYETEPELGAWRNRVVLVADDEFGDPPSFSEFFHTEQSEGIDTHISDLYDRTKIYLFEYPRDAAGEKPAAREAIVDAWNAGMLMIDYVGHGSPNQWAHEDVFRRTRELPRLFNGNRLPLVYTASCSIGFFDDPQQQGMGEELLRRAGGGAIAVISATRLVFSQPNVDLNEAVFDFLMDDAPMTVGQALFAGLLIRQYSIPGGPIPIENDRKHILIGDPLLRLARPALTVAFDTAVTSDSLVALDTLRVAGFVADTAGNPVNLGGELLLSVRDAPRSREYQVGTRLVKYELEGRPLFAGTFPSDAPDFDFSLIVPKDVSYGADGARIVLYGREGDRDAVGVLAPLPVSLAASATTDTEGPLWDLTINGERPAGRVRVGPADIWRARIADPLGVNITGGGHGISLTIDGDEFRNRDLTPQFVYDVGSFSAGTVTFSTPELEPGPHEVRLLAWDNANNPGMVAVSVDATGDLEYAIRDLLVYPNPFDPDSEPARLTYELTFPPDRVDLSIYSVAGNRIRRFRDGAAGVGFNYDVAWDGRDDTGDRVAAGVYILAVEAEAAGRTVKDFTKIVLIRSD